MEKSNKNYRQAGAKKSFKRIRSMDTARGIATWLLMPAHFSHWYLKIFPNPSWMTWLFRSILGTAFQYVFVTLPGMAVILQLYLGKRKGISEEKLKMSIIKRGLILILIQFICNFFSYQPHFTWNWFILSFIGFSIIISYYFTKISQRNRIIFIVVIIIISPIFKAVFFDYYIVSGLFLSDAWSIENFLFKMLFEVNFPIFPYIVLPVFGTLYAEKMIKYIEEDNQMKFIKESLILGSVLIIFYVLTLGMDSILNFPHIAFFSLPTRQDVLYSFGVVMFVTGLFYWLQDLKGKKWKLLKPFEIYGIISLTVFVTHFYIFPPILEMLYYPWGNLSEYSVFLFCSFFWAVYWIYGVLWKRYKRKYSLEWFLRQLS
ncbi:MAG: heparan-alpha-glucosaminide N-acetyltransferase domain-containing protein [Candidatus Helarchaeota archaeon]